MGETAAAARTVVPGHAPPKARTIPRRMLSQPGEPAERRAEARAALAGPPGLMGVTTEKADLGTSTNRPTMASPYLPSGTPSDIAAEAMRGSSLTDRDAAWLGRGLGEDLYRVGRHLHLSAAALASAASAHSFTIGSHVFFGQGEYQPDTPRGEALLRDGLSNDQPGEGSEQKAEETSDWAMRSPASSDCHGGARHACPSDGGRPLEPGVRADMEARLGHDFSHVRVHDDSRAHESATAVRAHAYTVGSDIVFQRGGYNPATPEGKLTLAHELTHVIQQSRGPVDGTETPDGIRISEPEDRFEREAAANAQRAISSSRSSHSLHRELRRGCPEKSSRPMAPHGVAAPNKQADVQAKGVTQTGRRPCRSGP